MSDEFPPTPSKSPPVAALPADPGDPAELDAVDRATYARVTMLSDGLGRTLRLSRALVEGGRTIDLDGIDSSVGRLCAQVLDLPLPASRRLRPRLITLLGEVAALEAALAGQGRPRRTD